MVDEKTFPWRLPERTRSLLAQMMSALVSHKAWLNSISGAKNFLLFDKSGGPALDVAIEFSNKGVRLSYLLNGVAKTDATTKEWLGRYHSSLVSLRGPLTPVEARCTVDVHVTLTGMVEYYLTYLVTHEDGSIAQETPQGLLVASEQLLLAQPAPFAQQAMPAEPAKVYDQTEVDRDRLEELEKLVAEAKADEDAAKPPREQEPAKSEQASDAGVEFILDL